MTDFYKTSGNRKGSLSLAGAGSNYILSPSTGDKISLKETTVSAEKVWDSVIKSKYNSRNRELLTPAAVLGILPSIRAARRNTMPVIAVLLGNGKYEILSGMRRCYAVSISPGCEVVIHYATEMSEDDKQLLASTSDQHDKPAFLDTALTIKDYKRELGDGFTLRNAAKVFNVSKSAVGDLVRFSELPMELFSLFPGAGYVAWDFLSKVVASGKTNAEIVAAISGIEKVSTDVDKVLSEDSDKILRAESKKLEAAILKCLDTTGKADNSQKTFDPRSPLHSSKLMKGVIAKQAARGAITLKLDKSVISSDIGKQIIALISKNER
jgi:hypothetical protein